MKTLLKSILFLGLTIQINAQNLQSVSLEFLNHPEVEKGIEFDQCITVFNALNVLVTPEFDSLFYESFTNVNGIKRLEKFYNDFDLGFNLGIDYCLKNGLKVKSVYNIGMMKFNQSNLQVIERYVVQLSISYVF